MQFVQMAHSDEVDTLHVVRNIFFGEVGCCREQGWPTQSLRRRLLVKVILLLWVIYLL